MRKTAVVSRRQALGWAARVAVGFVTGGCASIAGGARRRYGWESAAAIPGAEYRTQIWQPPGPRTAPVFVALLVDPGVAPTRILEPYAVEDRGAMQPATLIADLRARYPGLLPSDVEVEPLVAGAVTLGYVIRTRNINVYADLDPSLGQYSVRLGGQGKYPKKRGGGAGGAR